MVSMSSFAEINIVGVWSLASLRDFRSSIPFISGRLISNR